MTKHTTKLIIGLLIGLLCALFTTTISAQQEVQRDNPISAQCGNIIESSFSANYQEQNFVIPMNSGDALDVTITPAGGQLNTTIMITGPTNLGINISNGGYEPNRFRDSQVVPQPKITTEKLAASG